MMKFVYTCIVAALGIVLLNIEPVGASSLKIAPLVFKDQIQPGEVRKSYIDVSNTSDQEISVTTEIEAFKQVDQSGELAFYQKAEYSGGIVLDYDSFTLGPRETLRLYFALDARKLPVGGVHAAIFFKTAYATDSTQTGIQPMVRVGALLVVNNSSKPADIQVQKIRTPFVQFGKDIRTEIDLKNISPGDSGVAGAANVRASLWPFGGTKELESPLIFPGITRTVHTEIPSNYFGFVRLQASVGDDESHSWLFAVTGYGRFIAGAFVVAVFAVLIGRKQIKRCALTSFKRLASRKHK